MSEQEILRCENIGVCYHIGGMRFHGLRSYLLERTHGKGANVLWANRKISFGLERGDMLGILGKNGAGKSTLLKAIAGILAPAEGAITVNGSIAALLELTSGFDQDMTVRDNIYLRGAMLGCSAAFLKERYDKILAFAELTRFEDYAFYTLSSGMKSRLAFAIATLVDADILILDEIFAVGDGAFRKKSEAKILSMLENEKTTAMLVSHTTGQIRHLCNKVLWLDAGRQIAFSDNVEMVCNAYEEYLHSNVLPGADFSLSLLDDRYRERTQKEQYEADLQALREIATRLSPEEIAAALRDLSSDP